MQDRIHQHALAACASTSTPFYLLDLDAIRAARSATEAAWRQELPLTKVAYSFKSNSLRAIVDVMLAGGSWAEVVSGHELELALRAGFDGSRIVFDGPVKRPEELDLALTHGARIHVDSLDDLSQVLDRANALNVAPALGARLQTQYRGRPSRFGLTAAEFRTAASGLGGNGFRGVHLHVGSNINDPGAYAGAILAHGDLIADVLSTPNSWLDVGGGFPAHSLPGGEKPVGPGPYAAAVRAALVEIGAAPERTEVIIEPGRSLVEDHGYLVLSVASRKDWGPLPLLFMDGGGSLVRSIHTWYHPIEWLSEHAALRTSGDSAYCVFGANCFESDLICRKLPGPPGVGRGARIIIGSAGAYDLATAEEWIRPSPQIIGISNERRMQLPRSVRPGAAVLAEAMA